MSSKTKDSINKSKLNSFFQYTKVLKNLQYFNYEKIKR
jgi:hypothetical protein